MLAKKTRKTQRGEEFIERSVRKYPKIIFWIFLIYFVLFASYMMWYFYFISTYTLSTVDGISMQNTLNVQAIDGDDCYDWVYIHKNKQPEHFDIITLTSKEINVEDGSITDISLIKRAIAFEGDLITIKRATEKGEDGFFHVYIQQEGELTPKMLQEDYIKSYYEWTYSGSFSSVVYVDGVEYEREFYTNFILQNSDNTVKIGDTWYYQVPEDSVFYMGDNRAKSSDSRVRGVADIENIQGVVEIILKDAQNASDAQRLWIKTVSIFEFYWNELANYFSR